MTTEQTSERATQLGMIDDWIELSARSGKKRGVRRLEVQFQLSTAKAIFFINIGEQCMLEAEFKYIVLE